MTERLSGRGSITGTRLRLAITIPSRNPQGRFFYASTRATKVYSDFQFQDGDFFVFGKETKGLPQALIEANLDTCIRMPMRTDHVRSLNLSNSAAIIVYEALRQVGFPGLN
jgi:tRNA (cytidine/uridine-2'-O-)-methyltransferase